MSIEKSPELEAVFRRMWGIWQDGSVDGLSNMISSHPDVRFILSDDDDWIAGSDSLIRVISERSKLIDIERVEFDRVEAFESGDSGWAACVVTLVRSSGESFTSRSTASFVMEDGTWKAVQVHTSTSVSTESIFGHELAADLAALVESLDVSSAEAIAEIAGVSGTVTLMFTDIEGSTQLAQRQGDTTWHKQIQEHFDSVAGVVEDNGGKIVKTLGDGTMSAFATARGSVDAALSIERSAADAQMRVRIGIHTGEAISVGDDYAGLAVAKAARIASAADGGEILVSSATRELLSRFDYEFGTERKAQLKGLDGTHSMFPLT